MLYNLTYFNYNKNWPLDLSLETFELGHSNEGRKKKARILWFNPKRHCFCFLSPGFPLFFAKTPLSFRLLFYFWDRILLCVAQAGPPLLAFLSQPLQFLSAKIIWYGNTRARDFSIRDLLLYYKHVKWKQYFLSTCLEALIWVHFKYIISSLSSPSQDAVFETAVLSVENPWLGEIQWLYPTLQSG